MAPAFDFDLASLAGLDDKVRDATDDFLEDGIADGSTRHQSGAVDLRRHVARPVVVQVRAGEDLHARNALFDEAPLIGALGNAGHVLAGDPRDEAAATEDVLPLVGGPRAVDGERLVAEAAGLPVTIGSQGELGIGMVYEWRRYDQPDWNTNS